jgi:hypothetical protein
MHLPNYFLIDLPPEAILTSDMISEACQTLKRNRARYLAGRPTQSLIRVLSQLARDWLEPEFPFRKLVLADGPKATGFSAATLAAGLDDFFAALTLEENLELLLLQDLGHPQRLENLTASEVEQNCDRASFVRGPELLVQVTGGVLPNPTLLSMLLGLLARSAQFVKCATGSGYIPRLFAHSLYQAEPKLGACLEIAEWKGGTQTLETVLFNEADCLIVMGNDQTIAAIRRQVPHRVRVLGYGHRVSFGYVARAVLSEISARKVVSRAAHDVAAWNQLGCLSPHVIYVESGGTVSPLHFAELLAAELESLEGTRPRGSLGVEESGAIAARRYFHQVRAAHSPETKLWCSNGSTAWTVVYEADPVFQMSCLNRFIYVKGVSGLDQALRGAEAIRGQVSTVGLAAPKDEAYELAAELARWGVARVCPLGQMQNPPLTWRHDGRPSFGDLVTWTDWEQ